MTATLDSDVACAVCGRLHPAKDAPGDPCPPLAPSVLTAGGSYADGELVQRTEAL